jgi:hypothetical protein
LDQEVGLMQVVNITPHHTFIDTKSDVALQPIRLHEKE